MAIIKDVSEIKDLIPTFKDLIRCGNFANVEDGIYKSKELYAFSVNCVYGINIKAYKARFVLIGLQNVYALVLVNEKEEIGRYCDFVGVPRDVSKPIKLEDWKWSTDEIGLSITSDNANGNFIYFGTSISDEKLIRQELMIGKRDFIEYKKLDRELWLTIMEALKMGGKTNTSSVEILKCLPSPKDVKPVQHTEITTEIVYV